MKKYFLFVILFLLSGCSLQPTSPSWWSSDQPQTPSPEVTSVVGELRKVPDHSHQQIQIEDQMLSVEVVNTPESISQGLSGRTDIGSDGMLFVFPSKQHVSFWMPDMLFDLDLVWIAEDTVIGITEQVPHPLPNTPLERLPTYRPPAAVEMVLEVEAGKATQLHLKPGTRLQKASN